MSDKLTREEVLHVARLARIELNEEEIEKYQVQLKTLFNEVDKIKNVELKSDNKLIAPVMHTTKLREDVAGEMLEPEEIMKNVPVSNGNFVEVPVMINE
ncbi:MAG: Asp-tRNA(Asn)/Glu-tRNA(Gln) amidotransferase subunit GatC [Firmicutes bacterium]|nr:Asp-tRNA(Asn)/Glu-tRNA(Gln) amidotransferase subunit GatC [Bacillota bacterium]